MSNLPAAMTIELGEQDLNNDFLSAIHSMGDIRHEQLTERKISDEDKNEYLHLAYRLASIIEGQIDKDLIKKMHGVVSKLNMNKALLSYDFLQDRFWREVEPDFTKKLDQTTIHLMGDEFQGLEDKHHIFNALKYLGSRDELLETRLAVYDTILPFNHNSTKNNKKLFEQQIKKTLKKVKGVEGLVVRVKDINDLEHNLNVAGSLGFSHLRSVVNAKDYKQLLENNDYLISVIDKKFKEPLEKSQKKLKIPKMFYPIIGMLPGGFQQKLEDKLGIENFDAVEATKSSGRAHYAAAGALAFSSLVGWASEMNNWKWLAVGGGYLFIQEVIRNTIEERNTRNIFNYEEPIGTPHGAVLGAPCYLFKNPQKKNKLLIEINIPENKYQNRKHEKGKNYHPDIEKLALEIFSQEKEQNLIWSLDNHHTQGKYFEQELRSGKINLNGFGSERYLAKEIGALALYDVFESKPYKKVSALMAFPNQRYVMTYINDNKNSCDFQEMSRILSQDKPVKDKLQLVSNHIEPEYMHLSKFNGGEKTEDYTVRK